MKKQITELDYKEILDIKFIEKVGSPFDCDFPIVKKLKPDSMSEQEFKNWHESCNTKFMKYCNFLTRNGQHLAAHLLPFMNDYSHEWTDKLFYDYFKLTKDEMDIIEQFGKLYIYCDTRK